MIYYKSRVKKNVIFMFQRYKSSLNIIFYGSDKFSLQTLKSLYSNLLLTDLKSKKVVNSLHICTSSNNNIVGKYCMKHNLKLFDWPYSFSKDFYDLGIVVSFGKLIDENAISSCKYGILNVHPSLLPKLRGPAPIQRSILNNDKETGVTIMSIKPNKFDVGDILLQEKIFLNDESSYNELFYKLSKLGINLLFQCLNNIEYNIKCAIKQNSKNATFAPKIKLEETKIIWNQMNLDYIYRLFRAFYGFKPIYTELNNGENLIIFKMLSPKETNLMKLDKFVNEYTNIKMENIEPGIMCFHKKRKLLFVKCVDNWAGFSQVSIKNHKKMSALEFYNGFLSKKNKKMILK